MYWLCAWCWLHPWKSLLLVLLVSFVILQALAYQHAHGMTHFTRGPGRGLPASPSLWAKVRVLLCGVRLSRPMDPATPADVNLRFETHQVEGKGGTLDAWHVPQPSSRGIVLIFHGYGSCKAELLPEVKGFADLGYSCFAVDFRGSGDSAGDTTTIGFHEAEDVADAVAHVRERWPGQPILLFAPSMGAAAVLRAVGVLGVEADALLLECPFDRMLTAVRARFRALGVVSFPFAETLVFWGGAQHGFNAFRHEPVAYAEGVNCPVLLLHGAEDPRVRVSEVQAIHDRLGGEKMVHLFPGLGHESYVSRQPDAWRRQIEAFLTRYLPGARSAS
jgi:alpha-beta hydrolase superfamily lysophospholipase